MSPSKDNLRIPARARLARFQPRVPQAWRDQFDAFWSARNPREQAILAAGAAVLGLVLIYTVLWEPAADGRARLSRSLSAMRAELAEMETLAQEARGLNASPAPALRGDALTHRLPIVDGELHPVVLVDAQRAVVTGQRPLETDRIRRLAVRTGTTALPATRGERQRPHSHRNSELNEPLAEHRGPPTAVGIPDAPTRHLAPPRHPRHTLRVTWPETYAVIKQADRARRNM